MFTEVPMFVHKISEKSPLAPQPTEKYCPGHITREPAGESGFGYDPIFVPDGFDRTFAELGDEIKNKISHRAMAVKGIAEKLIPVVQSYAVRGM